MYLAYPQQAQTVVLMMHLDVLPETLVIWIASVPVHSSLPTSTDYFLFFEKTTTLTEMSAFIWAQRCYPATQHLVNHVHKVIFTISQR